MPDIILQIRTEIYPHLAPIASAWFQALNIDKQFPLERAELVQQCHENGQLKATVFILKYGKGGFNTLQQDLYGNIYFPIQTLAALKDIRLIVNDGKVVVVKPD